MLVNKFNGMLYNKLIAGKKTVWGCNSTNKTVKNCLGRDKLKTDLG